MSNAAGTPEITGAKALVQILEEKGVDCIFGYPGGANLPIYDELYHSKKIRHVLARHEQGAAHMAEGYARVAHKPGVCLATSGPGATNLVTGLADALLDSIPVVAITGQIPRAAIGTDAFQEVDCVNITMPVTKHNELVNQEKDLVGAIENAFYIANSGRKGPVLIDLPKDLLLNKFPHVFGERPELPGYQPTTQGNIGQVKKALKKLAQAERPVILVGGGVIASGASQEVVAFAEKTQIPIVRTLLGTGIVPVGNPLYIGLIGTHGNTLANRLVQNQADVIFAIGTKLGNRATIKAGNFGKNAKIIHLDIDPAEIGKSMDIAVPIVGDVRETITHMLERIEKKPIRLGAKPWVTGEKTTHMLSTKDDAEVLERVFTELTTIDQKLHVTTDVGRHQMWANHFITNPNHLPLITSAGLGTMGFGLPAAIGASFADPGTPVVNLTGDGSFMMNMQEFNVACEYNLPLTVVILDDMKLGMIRELQTSEYGQRYFSHKFPKAMDFIKLAEAMGGKGVNVHRPEEIGPTLKRVIASRVPTIIRFDIQKLAQTDHLQMQVG